MKMKSPVNLISQKAFCHIDKTHLVMKCPKHTDYWVQFMQNFFHSHHRLNGFQHPLMTKLNWSINKLISGNQWK